MKKITRSNLQKMLINKYCFNEMTDENERMICISKLDEILDKLYDLTNQKVFPLDVDETLIIRKKFGILDGGFCMTCDEIVIDTHITSTSRVLRMLDKGMRKINKYCTSVVLKSNQEEVECLDLEQNISIDKLGLSTRAYNGLRRAGINNLEDLIKYNSTDLVSIRNIGQNSLLEIMNAVHRQGLSFFDETKLFDFLCNGDSRASIIERYKSLVDEQKLLTIRYEALEREKSMILNLLEADSKGNTCEEKVKVKILKN